MNKLLSIMCALFLMLAKPLFAASEAELLLREAAVEVVVSFAPYYAAMQGKIHPEAIKKQSALQRLWEDAEKFYKAVLKSERSQFGHRKNFSAVVRDIDEGKIQTTDQLLNDERYKKFTDDLKQSLSTIIEAKNLLTLAEDGLLKFVNIGDVKSDELRVAAEKLWDSIAVSEKFDPSISKAELEKHYAAFLRETDPQKKIAGAVKFLTEARFALLQSLKTKETIAAVEKRLAEENPSASPEVNSETKPVEEKNGEEPQTQPGINPKKLKNKYLIWGMGSLVTTLFGGSLTVMFLSDVTGDGPFFVGERISGPAVLGVGLIGFVATITAKIIASRREKKRLAAEGASVPEPASVQSQDEPVKSEKAPRSEMLQYIQPWRVMVNAVVGGTASDVPNCGFGSLFEHLSKEMLSSCDQFGFSLEARRVMTCVRNF